MRTMTSLLSPLAMAALCAAAASPAAAQRAAAPASLRPVVHSSAAVDAAITRTVAVYRFGAPREVGMPTEVTLADSAGKLVAGFRLPGTNAVRPMTVDVLNSDLILKGESPSGPLTLVLYRQNDPEATDAWIGRWSVGSHAGELRGRSVR